MRGDCQDSALKKGPGHSVLAPNLTGILPAPPVVAAAGDALAYVMLWPALLNDLYPQHQQISFRTDHYASSPSRSNSCIISTHLNCEPGAEATEARVFSAGRLPFVPLVCCG